MSRIVNMGVQATKIVPMIQAGQLPGLRIVANMDDRSSQYWPLGIEDASGNTGWMEGDLMLFWGQSREAGIVAGLKDAGFRPHYIE